jgi:hypothetical protein
MSPPEMNDSALPNPHTALRRIFRRLPFISRPLIPVFVAAALFATAVHADDDALDAEAIAIGASAVNFHVVVDQIPIVGMIVVDKPGDGALTNLKQGRIYEIRINDSMFALAAFGKQTSIEAVRERLDKSLRQKIEFADCICGLSAAQKQKLELAGRGDIVRFLRRVDDLHQKPQVLWAEEEQLPHQGLMQWGRKFSAEIQPLRNKYESGMFGAGSLFAQIRDRTLTAEQRDRYDAVREIERVGGKFVVRPRQPGSEATNEIQFSATRIDDAGLAQLKLARGLHSLLLDNTKITDAGLVSLAGLAELEVLDLRHTRITDAGLESLPALVNLKSLRLDGTKITDAGLVHLKKLTKLEYLHLGGTAITGAGFDHLQGLTNLKDFYLGETQVDDASLAHLRGLTSLEHLSLADTRVTNAGLANLGGLAHLKRLFLIGTDVTAEGTTELRLSLPNLTIIR